MSVTDAWATLQDHWLLQRNKDIRKGRSYTLQRSMQLLAVVLWALPAPAPVLPDASRFSSQSPCS